MYFCPEMVFSATSANQGTRSRGSNFKSFLHHFYPFCCFQCLVWVPMWGLFARRVVWVPMLESRRYFRCIFVAARNFVRLLMWRTCQRFRRLLEPSVPNEWGDRAVDNLIIVATVCWKQFDFPEKKTIGAEWCLHNFFCFFPDCHSEFINPQATKAFSWPHPAIEGNSLWAQTWGKAPSMDAIFAANMGRSPTLTQLRFD